MTVREREESISWASLQFLPDGLSDLPHGVVLCGQNTRHTHLDNRQQMEDITRQKGSVQPLTVMILHARDVGIIYIYVQSC